MNRRLHTTISSAVAALCFMALTACSSPLALPTGGSVQTLAPVQQQTQRVYTNPQGPVDDAQPEGIVQGFYDAMPAGVQSDGYQVAREFLTSSASVGWNGDNAAVIYSGTPDFRRRANTMTAPQGAESTLIVEVEVQVVGILDSRGLYTPVHDTQPRKLSYTLIKQKGQWRISSLENGVVISTADFDQVFRQVSVYQVSSSGKQLVPDVRWLSWRNWRTQAVREILGSVPSWLEGAVQEPHLATVSLAVDSVPMQDTAVTVSLTNGMNALSDEDRSMLVHRIRLTLGDGNSGYNLKVTGDGVDYSDADSNIKLSADQPAVGVYTLTGGHIVSLSSSSPLRVADAPGFDNALGFAFSANGGAVLRADGVAECLSANGGSCGVLFGGVRIRSVTAGLNGEVWAVGDDGRTLYIHRNGQSAKITIPWLDADGRVTSVNVSTEGSRLALAVDGGSFSGVAITGIVRDENNDVTGLSKAAAQVSLTQDVAMLSFYNDLNLVYATSAGTDGTRQSAYRQIVPGPAVTQRLPEGTSVSMASGQISLYRRLSVLDNTGTVRSVSGSLDGSWSIADSQVDALGSQ
ncbi:LpqB family beta-propeller domain-containing protein [Bifidobacterium felsineum]|uniref:Uncharacterized protein n=1 Tax=Bifidobacterium felsineum TaxID=2045440 RepID=A0A2M9HMQ1_9BIFI|nr:LpqB family beta-propeller domain-containing protein [Bifidobacterium felsineum]MBT1163842.1 hypothetical protein [Bifidobacterium felsineum]PJM78075.1 hypothetical protein CSQ86_03370 [Bifidobacterium felsineum]